MENPELLHLLWVLGLYALVLWVYWRWRARTLRQLGSPALAERLLLGFSPIRFWVKNGLFAGALALLAIAIANPRRTRQTTPPPQESADVLIALDVSRSMLAQDASPARPSSGSAISRLEQAKIFAQQLAASLDGERLGLIFFAGDAYPQMPLSTDAEALALFVRNATPDFVGEQGTDFTPTLELATRLFDSNSEAGRALILISDGEQQAADASDLAQKIFAEERIVLHTVSVGTPSGTTIPDGAGGYKRDWKGEVIRTRADDALLRQLARAGGGVAVSASSPGAIQTLREEISHLRKSAVQAQSRTEYVSFYEWFALLALVLLITEQVLWWRNPHK